jgi:hypothetical protein
MVIRIPRGMTAMLVMLMDLLLPVQFSQLAQTTTIVTPTRTSQQVLILMAIHILHHHLPQRRPCIIIRTHTLIRLRLLIYQSHPPIRILHQPIVLTIHMLQPIQKTCTTHILIHICRMTIRLRTGLGQCQRVIVALEDQ